MEEKKALKIKAQKPENLIKGAAISAYIVAGLTLIVGLGVLKNPFMLIDVALIAGLGTIILLKKSRVAAVLLFSYYLINAVINAMNGIRPGALTIVFVVAFLMGIQGTFKYHKEKANQKPDLSLKPDSDSQGPISY